MTHATRSGGRILVDALRIHGATIAFGVPGESYLDVLDALADSPIRFIVNRQEGGAAFMAEAWGKLTGLPGLCFVTRGPGATNAAIAVHTAFQDSTPMILFIGQVGGDFVEREAFQEIDYRRMFGPLAKWVAQIDRSERIPEFIARAYQTATSGRPGPVVLALPEDMLAARTDAADTAPFRPVQALPALDQVAALRALLADAQRPFLLVGGSSWTAQDCAALRQFVETNMLPVGCVFRRQDLLDNEHPHYAGDVGLGVNPRLAERIRAADVLIALGTRLGEIATSGYTLVEAPVPRQRLVHIHADANELGRVFQAALMINSAPGPMIQALAAMAPVDSSAWAGSVAQARAELAAWQARPPVFDELDAPLDLWQVVQDLMAQAPRDTIITNGAGSYATWAHRFYRYGPMRTQLAPTSGSMGYAVPAAVAAKLADPDRTVVCFAGDGEFMMSGQELATAVQYGAGIIVLVFNNGMFGTIRMHQERSYPGRVSGTGVRNPDFCALARAYGAQGEVVERTADFAPALARALAFTRANGLPALLELRYDGNLITPNASLDSLRRAAQSAASGAQA
jgi:acetolactate synthase-1/2/3 large subunit